MDLAKLRSESEQKIKEYESRLQTMEEKDVQHFRQEGNGPLANITDHIVAEYRRHIETYAALIAQIDAILGA
jgi:iron-sulfur cluster repair protein YtfE (RIC family)